MNEGTTSGQRLFLFGMILSMTCWGFSWTSGKILSAYADPLTISFFRFAATFVSLIVILAFARIPMSIRRSGVRDLVVASALISLYTFLFFKGLTVGKAGAGGILVTVLNPIISYIIMLAMARRKPTTAEFWGLSLGILAGVILLRVFSDASALWSAGNIYFLLASFAWAALSLVTARASRYGSPVTFSCWMYAVSTFIMLVLSIDLPAYGALLANADAAFWGNMFFSSTITTAGATTFYFVATSKIGAGKASSFIFLVPFSAALGSWIFLNEVPQLHSILGGVLGIAAVYILNMRKRVQA